MTTCSVRLSSREVLNTKLHELMRRWRLQRRFWRSRLGWLRKELNVGIIGCTTMGANVRANIELTAQVVIAIAIVITAGVLVKRTVFPGQASGRMPSINAGERLSLPNVDWAQNKKSLVFFLKKDCPYCTSSAELYRQLVEEATRRNVKCVAVFPNTLEDARKYLRYIELPIENVYTSRLGD